MTDDAALLDVPPDRELVVTADAMVAGVHFLPGDDPGDIAAKLLRVNLSDLAAMAADPLGYTLVTMLTRDIDDDWFERFTQGLEADQRAYALHLIGGDSVSTSGPIAFTVTAFGVVPRGRSVRRGTGSVGDLIFVSGSIGDAFLGLLLAQEHLSVSDAAHSTHLLRRLRRPEPRLPLVPVLRAGATAAADVSDGLVADLGHIAEASGCAAVIHADAVPLSDAAQAIVADRPDLLPFLLTGGDDYELVFTAPADRRQAILEAADRSGVPVRDIGYLTRGQAGIVSVMDGQGAEMPIRARGWTHF